MIFKKKQIAIVGSTGSVGKSTLKIIEKYPDFFQVILLVCNSNKKIIEEQILKFSPKYILINNKKVRSKLKQKFKRKTNFLNTIDDLNKIFSSKSKIDKSIISVPSIIGLNYSFELIKYSKELLIANKESIICGGKILINESAKNKCKLTSIDSEHYCIQSVLKHHNINTVDSIYLTASGGPFLNKNYNSIKKASVKMVTNHPTWSMGKKISVDSATLVNKIYEMIEAHILFDIHPNNIRIKIHKESAVHSAIIFKNGLVNLVMHNTSMTIPIRNSLFDNNFFYEKNFSFKNNNTFSLTFDEMNLKKFKILMLGRKILEAGQASWILFNVFNDYFVYKFLRKKIFFYEIVKNLNKIFNNKSVNLYCKNKINNKQDINNAISFANNFLKEYEQ